MKRVQSYVKAPCCTKPCKECPFRKDTKLRLGRSKVNEILTSQSFVCHNTINGSEKDMKQCAGHMIMLKEENKFYSFAKKIGWKLNLTGENTVFKTIEKCHDHHAYNSPRVERTY